MASSIRKGLFTQLFKEINSLPLDTNRSKILDVGCGDGYFLMKCQEVGFTNLYGMDGTDDHIDERIHHVKQYYEGALPFEDDFFESVFFLDVIEHVDNQIGLIHEAHRVLTQGGYLVISTPNIYSILGKIKFLFLDRLHGFDDRCVDLPKGHAHITPFISNIVEIVFHEKFNIIGTHHYGFIIPFFNTYFSIDNKYISGNKTVILQKK